GGIAHLNRQRRRLKETSYGETDVTGPGATRLRRRGWGGGRDWDDDRGADPGRVLPEAGPLLLADHWGPRLDPPVEHGAGRGADGALRGRCATSAADGPGRGVGAAAARVIRPGLHHRRFVESRSSSRLPARHHTRDGAYHLAWGR